MEKRNQIVVTEYESQCGKLRLGSIGDTLCLCDWVGERNRDAILRRLTSLLDAEIVKGTTPVTEAACCQLDEYFAGERDEFEIPLQMCGTGYQRGVWNELLKIDYGQKITYMELAERIGNKKASRAVANACNANALSIFIPCHRIVGSNGSMTGYAGGLPAKTFLLTLEAGNS